nr:MAG TPA: hypothetical protein [Caudoviricetes sp.]
MNFRALLYLLFAFAVRTGLEPVKLYHYKLST